MSSVEFSRGRILLRNWKNQLNEFAKTPQAQTKDEFVDPKACLLGKWIYGEGLENYPRDADMNRLEKTHAKMHARVADYLKMKNSGNVFGADRDWEKIESLSEEIMGLLDTLENKYKNK